MTLQQETAEKVLLLPDKNALIVLAVVNEMLRQNHQANVQPEISEEELEEKRKAVQHILEMREKYPYPKDFDFDKAREEAMKEKYGRFI